MKKIQYPVVPRGTTTVKEGRTKKGTKQPQEESPVGPKKKQRKVAPFAKGSLLADIDEEYESPSEVNCSHS